MADRSIIVRIGAKVDGLVNGLKTADKAAQDWGNKSLSYIQKNSQSINTLANGLGLIGGALTGLAVLAVKSFADFDAAMSSVQAATMESAGNMDLLSEAAIEAGARTQYSATEAAGAIEELAKAGVSTADILAGGLDGALDLAASGAIGVSDAAEIAATAMTQFGLSGSDVTHIADLLAAGAGKAQGGVDDLGAALNQAGLVANQTGLTIEETTAGLTAFASAGLVGSDAGTSFKSMLQRLTPTSAKSKAEMERLGISAYDAQGNFIGLAEFAGNLQGALADLTPEQRNAALATIFGSDAVRAANVIYEQGYDGIQQWTEAVNDQGYAAEQAAIRMDNLKGDIEGLSGSTETALIGMGEAANGPLRAIVQGLDNVVDGFNNLSDGAQAATLWVIGGAGLVTLGVAGLGKLAVSTANVINSLKEMGIITQATAGRMGAFAGNAAKFAGVAAALAAVGVAAGKIVEALNGSVVSDVEAFADALNGLAETGDISDIELSLQGASRAVNGLGENVSDIKTFGDAFNRVFNKSASDNVNDWVSSLFGASNSGSKLAESFSNIDTALAEMVNGGNMDQAYAAFSEIRKEAEASGIPLDELRQAFPEYAAAVQEATLSVESATPAQDAYNESMDNGGASAEQYADALQEAIDAQDEQVDRLLTARDAMRGYEAALDDATEALEENGATLDITTEKGRENQEALDGIVTAHNDVIASMREDDATQVELQAQTQRTRDDFIRAAEAFGMSADEARALADEMGLIPENVTPTIAIDDQASGVLDGLWTKITTLPDRTVTVNVKTNETTVTTGVANQRARASGGAIYGPGTGTSDTAGLFALSNGEHVLTASDVSKLGGQSAVYSLRTAIQSGWKPDGFAQGGAVASASMQYAPPAHLSAPASARQAAPSVTYNVTQHITTADPLASGIAGIRRLEALEA